MNQRSETSAGGVVYRQIQSSEGVEVAIAEQRDRITSALTKRLPKGHVELGETAEQAAVREVAEEIGLCARVVDRLGTARYVYHEQSQAVDKQVHYFLMEWLPSGPLPLDGEMERVYWCSLDEAERDLTFETEQRAIRWARSRLHAKRRR